MLSSLTSRLQLMHEQSCQQSTESVLELADCMRSDLCTTHPSSRSWDVATSTFHPAALLIPSPVSIHVSCHFIFKEVPQGVEVACYWLLYTPVCDLTTIPIVAVLELVDLVLLHILLSAHPALNRQVLAISHTHPLWIWYCFQRLLLLCSASCIQSGRYLSD